MRATSAYNRDEPQLVIGDHDLLTALRADHESAFDAIFRAYYPQLVRYAETILGERARAEEIAQDVMLELWRRRHTLAVESSLRSYLFRAAHNRSLNHLRHEKVVRRDAQIAAPDLISAPLSLHQIVQNEIDAALHKSMALLPPRCREVFELSRVHGLRYAEIAAAMNISIKTVEGQMSKALRIMREAMSPWMSESPVST